MGISNMSSNAQSSGGTDSHNIRYLICNAGAGAAAGAIAATFVCPLDVIKTRLQVHGLPPGKKGSVIVTSLQNIVRTEGFRGMYRGLSPTILPNWAVYFTFYEQLKGLLCSRDGCSQLTTVGNIGIVPSLAGISHVAIQFPAYEKIKSYMAKKDNTTVDKLSPGNVAIASSISKVTSSVMTYPHEVIRSRLQEQGHAKIIEVRSVGVVDCTRKVFQKEGFPGFYRGCATNLLRTTPSAAITFTSYEMIHRFLQRVVPQDNGYPPGYPKSYELNKPSQKTVTLILKMALIGGNHHLSLIRKLLQFLWEIKSS